MQGISFQVSIARICKERGMGLPWFTTKSQIMTLFYLAKQGRSQLIYSTEHVLENLGWNCPVALPLIGGSANKTCQNHLETGAANVWDLIQSDQ